MATNLTKRSLVWIAAGLAAIGFVVALLVAISGGNSHAEDATPAHPGQQQIGRANLAARNLPTVRVKTVQPTRDRLLRTSTQAAQVEPYEEADLFAKVPGYLETVHVDIGDRVSKGQVLAELWVPEMQQDRLHKEALVEKAQAEVNQAEAAIRAATAMVDSAKAKVDEARSQIARYEAESAFRKIEHNRHQQLFDERAIQRDIVDEKQNQLLAAEARTAAAKATAATAAAGLVVEQARLNQAQADLASARAHMKVAQAELEHASVMLRYAKITAPFDGVVTQRFIHPGAFIQSAAGGKADPLFHLVRTDRMRIVADLPENDSSWVKIGQPALLQVNAFRGQTFPGKVVRFADALDPATRTMRVEVELDPSNTVLRPGMYGSVAVTLADYENALMLPTSVLLAGSGEPAVMVANGHQAKRRAIEIGQNDGIRMHVIGGLDGSEQVIAEGKDSVRDGQPVEVVVR